MTKKKPLIILTGPTSVGKTRLSILLAKLLHGEIISADSMQVYRGMDIGSAKIRPDEMDGIKHHLIDILDPNDTFDILQFQTCAKSAIDEIYERGHLPIIVGGTGFYIQSVLYDIAFTEEADDGKYRASLEELAMQKGVEFLHKMLQEVDPEAAEEIHPNNQKRVIRALEFYHLSGKKISEHNKEEHEKQEAYQACYFVLNDKRELIYDRINERVDQMLKEGLVEEVKNLKQKGCTRDMVSMQGLGYKEILDYLDGTITLEEAVYRIKRDTRHFAKRQLTWFRREKNVIWIQKDLFHYDDEEILQFMIEEIKKKGLLEE